MAESKPKNREITLRIKTASHKSAEDLELHVQISSTTVKQVKEMIREKYPFRPEIREQRLIYAGHILTDDQIFGDFLIPNTDGGEETYVIHLSCTSSFTRREKAASAANTTRNDSQRGGHESGGATSDQFMNNPWANQAPLPQAMPQDIAALHQMYLQQMLGFMAQWNAGMPSYGFQPVQFGANAAPAAGFNFQPAPGLVHRFHPAQQPAAAAAAPPPPPAAPAPRVVENDEDGQQADMLDWIYTLSRVALIFSVVYFYSNLTRLMLVIIFTGLVFVLQRRQAGGRRHNEEQLPRQNNNNNGVVGANNNNNNNVNVAAAAGNVNPPPHPVPAPAAAAARPEPPLAQQEGAPATGEPINVNANQQQNEPPTIPAAGSDQPPTVPPAEAERIQRFNLWTFVTAFVTSLIPMDMGQFAN